MPPGVPGPPLCTKRPNKKLSGGNLLRAVATANAEPEALGDKREASWGGSTKGLGFCFMLCNFGSAPCLSFRS